MWVLGAGTAAAPSPPGKSDVSGAAEPPPSEVVLVDDVVALVQELGAGVVDRDDRVVWSIILEGSIAARAQLRDHAGLPQGPTRNAHAIRSAREFAIRNTRAAA